MKIAVLGGTGPEGLGLAARFAQLGETVILGSRSAERAEEAAKGLKAKIPNAVVSGASNADASAAADLVVLAFPADGIDTILPDCAKALDGKVVLDTIVPMKFEGKFAGVEPPSEGSAGERIQAKLPGSKVVSGFKHQSAHHLSDVEHLMEGDVLICGNDEGAKATVAELVLRIKDLRPVDAGDLKNARHFEPMTALLLNINRKHKTRASFSVLGV
jgi:NADPH-dependent F420 reductase